MTTPPDERRDDLDELLPWYATGALSPRDSERIAHALRQDADLARRYALVREELAETIGLNERLAPPPARLMEKLFTKIDAEPARAAPAAAGSWPLLAWLEAWFARLSPQALAWAAGAAAIVLLLQAGLLARVYLAPGGALETVTETPAARKGSFLLVRFAPSAMAADIAAFLRERNAVVVDGPRDGYFRVKIADIPLPQDELQRLATDLQTTSSLIELALPAPGKP